MLSGDPLRPVAELEGGWYPIAIEKMLIPTASSASPTAATPAPPPAPPAAAAAAAAAAAPQPIDASASNPAPAHQPPAALATAAPTPLPAGVEQEVVVLCKRTDTKAYLKSSEAQRLLRADKAQYDRTRKQLAAAIASNAEAMAQEKQSGGAELSQIGALFLEGERLKQEYDKPFVSPHQNCEPDLMVTDSCVRLRFGFHRIGSQLVWLERVHSTLPALNVAHAHGAATQNPAFHTRVHVSSSAAQIQISMQLCSCSHASTYLSSELR